MINFDEIRPYRDSEITEVIERLLSHPQFNSIIAFTFPEESIEAIHARTRAVKSVQELQALFSYTAVGRIISNSADGFTITGLEELDPDQGYLFISNHRDIIMDSALLSYSLVHINRDTVEIGTGDNLFFSPFISDLMKLNRSFKIHRSLSPRELLTYSVRLSHYIRQRIATDNNSIWIAQRNGRAKDGHDQTETGLLKMLGLSDTDFLSGFRELQIVPMAVSYEYEPCDRFKARELAYKDAGRTFEKTTQDDFLNMQAGILEHKGKIQISLGKPLDQELEGLAEIVNKNNRFRDFRELMDTKIQALYKLFPTHYIAADMLQNGHRFEDKYTLAEKNAFEQHLEKTRALMENDKIELLPFLLNMYANPVENQLQAGIHASRES